MEQQLPQAVNQDNGCNFIFIQSHYSPNQLFHPSLRDAGISQIRPGFGGPSLHQEEALDSGYNADYSGDSPPVLTHVLPDPFALPVVNKRNTKLSVLNAQLSDQFSAHTRNNSSMTVSDLGISHSINTPSDLASVSEAAVIRQHAPHVSKKDIFCIFADLQKNKLSPLNLIVEVVVESCPEHDHYRQKVYNDNNKHKLENILDMIMDDVRGRIVLLEWMRPHALQQVHDTVYNKMDALTSELHTTTNTITPEYLMSWSLKANVEDIVDTNTPCLLGLIDIASQT